MDATQRINEKFDRLVALGRGAVAARPLAERVVYYVIATRCEIDIDGFAAVFEQALKPTELDSLIDGLGRIGEPELAAEFRRGYESLKADGFYEHMIWKHVSPAVKDDIDAIGQRVGDRLWKLDEKLALLLDASAG